MAGIIGGWFLLSVVSNQKGIRHLYCPVDNEGVSEVICSSMRCTYKYFFFVPFSEFWEEKGIGYTPKSWCIEAVLNQMNPS